MNAEGRLAKARARDAPRHSVPLDILVVDDDPATRLSLSYALTDGEHRVVEAADGAEALILVSERTFDVAIVDVRLPKVDGLAVFRKIRQAAPSTAVILMTAFATVLDAVNSLREGAYDYVTKPFDPEEFSLRVIGHIAEHRALRQELEEARKLVASRDAGPLVVGHAPLMQHLVERINTVAQSDAPVLLRGETGTGKELVAHTLHARGPRKSGPFVVMSCGAIPGDRFETELFGHVRGAFPGAVREREGRFVAADGGTLLLDEITEMPSSCQLRLLRALEEGAIHLPGEERPRPVNVRVVASTRLDLRELVARGSFREDLYLAINVLDIDLPPLRERRADLPLLLAHFLRRFYPGRVPPSISARAWAALMDYPFPGNVREFAHAIERAIVLAHGSEIDLEHLPPSITDSVTPSALADAGFRPLNVALRDFEKQYIQRAMKLAGFEVAHAADLLGMSRKHLVTKLRQLGITDGPGLAEALSDGARSEEAPQAMAPPMGRRA